MNVSKSYPVLCWWSGGVTSAVACKIAIDWFGLKNCKVVFIDTRNESDDTIKFKSQCEKWYGCEILDISSNDYKSIQEVWYKFNTLNTATGAMCSTKLKRYVRLHYQNITRFSYQVFGYEIDELQRAKSMKLNNPDTRPIFPLIASFLSKKDCIDIIQAANDMFLKIEIPEMYKMGFQNNNCWKTGCVQGGVGYWQKMAREFPEKFDVMAKVEHDLTDRKGEPVTMLKDQSEGGGLVFLKPHLKYPEIKDISMLKGREPKPLVDCNGFCGTNDLSDRNETESEINYPLNNSYAEL